MAKVKFGEIATIEAVLSQWWNVKGLPWALLQQVDSIITAVATGKETFDKMKHKLIDDYAEKDESGQVVMVVDANGQSTGIPSFGDNQAKVDELWDELITADFDCPTLPAQMLADNVDKLGLTPGTMRMIKPLVAQE